MKEQALSTWLDLEFVKDVAPRAPMRSAVRTGWETVIFVIEDEVESFGGEPPTMEALAGLGEAIRAAERLVQEWRRR